MKIPDPTHTWPESEWAFGEPDYVIEIPEQQIPATGVLDYIYLTVPIDIEEDKWVRASQYVAGDRSVLHHTVHDLIGPDGKRNSPLNTARITRLCTRRRTAPRGTQYRRHPEKGQRHPPQPALHNQRQGNHRRQPHRPYGSIPMVSFLRNV